MIQCARIASVSELPPEGKVREFSFGSRSICIANHDGAYTAFDSICPHKGGPLSEGSIEDGNLVCPWHGWKFALASGQCQNRTGVSVGVFELEIRGEDVFLKS